MSKTPSWLTKAKAKANVAPDDCQPPKGRMREQELPSAQLVAPKGRTALGLAPEGRMREQELPSAQLVPYKNYYECVPKSILASIPKIKYENEKLIHVELPSGIIICGSTGGGKTNLLLQFLSLTDCFQRVSIFARHTDEILYRFLIDALNRAGIQCDVSNNLDDVFSSEDYDPDVPSCCIFDDFMSAPKKALDPIIQLFSTGRKRNVVPIWITQSYFEGTPQSIRQNASYIFLFKIQNYNDAKRICADTSLDGDPDKLVQRLSDIQSRGKGRFMLIDRKTSDPKLKNRICWGDPE